MKGVWLHILIGLFLAAIMARALMGPAGVSLGGRVEAGGLPAIAVAAILYFASHFLRCIRLALLATPILDMSARTGLLLHLYTAPVAVAIPFKLGELFRIQQLASTSRRVAATLVMVVVERALDAACLLVICGFLYLGTEMTTAKLNDLTLILIGFTVAMLVTFVLAPSALNSLQRYIVLRHTNLRARLLLASIDRIRETTRIGYDCLTGNTGALMTISILIWTTEIAAMAALLTAEARTVALAALGTVERIGSEWRWLLGMEGGTTLIMQASVISFATLVVIWPVVAVLYAQRLALPPRQLTRRIVNEDT